MVSVLFQLMGETFDSIHAAFRSDENVVKETQEIDEHFHLTGELAGALHFSYREKI